MNQPDDPGVPPRPFNPWPAGLWFLFLYLLGLLIWNFWP